MVWMMKYYSATGTPIRESTGETDRRKAQRVADAKETDKGRGLPVAAGVGKIRWEAAVALYENDYRNNDQSSLADQQRRLRLHLTPVFAGYRMAEIGPAEIAAYITQRRADGAAAGTVNRETDIIRRIFTLCVQGELLIYQPHVPRLRERNARAGFFERAAFEDVRAQLPAELQAVVTFAYITGWRINSEVLTREWRHVDLDEGNEIRLDPGETKNGEPRTFPLTQDLRAVLLERRAARNAALAAGHLCPWVFFRPGTPAILGRPLPVLDFRRAWATACAAAGCPGKIPHDFRRTAVRNMVRRGVPERVAMQLSGHLTRSVFERYNIVSEGDLTDAATRLEGLAPIATGPQTGPFSEGVNIMTGTQTGTPAAQTGTDGITARKNIRKFSGSSGR
jgi:integrase